MKIYEFRAGTPKDDMIMGLSYPATFMIPALIILLILEIAIPNKNITHISTLNILVMAGILIPSFIVGKMLATHIKSKLGHDFKVQIENKKITVWIDDKINFVDNLEDIMIKENTQIFRLTICGTEKDICFIGREQINPFGFCREYDLLELRELAAYLQKIS